MAGTGSVCKSCTGLGSNPCLKQPLQPPMTPIPQGFWVCGGCPPTLPCEWGADGSRPPTACGSASLFWGCRFPESQATLCLPLAPGWTEP